MSKARNCHIDWWTQNLRKVLFFFWDTLYIIDLVLYAIFKGYMQYTKYKGHNNTNCIVELMQKAPKSGDLSPLNSVQLLRENISHKQTLTKTCHANICFLSRFLYAKISFKVFTEYTQELQIFQHKNCNLCGVKSANSWTFPAFLTPFNRALWSLRFTSLRERELD